MGGKFWFFTDVDRLAAQGAAEAFGPVTGSEATQFRVTDLHSAAGTNAPRAYAICDGLLRAQLDDEGGLTLILKPSQQPPFDFPPIAFFLYKGIRPDSLLKGGAPWPLVDPAKAGDSPLVARMVQDWQANGNTGDPSSKSLGLHLDPATPVSAGFDPTLYADDQPLDNLFYHGDGLFPPRLVSGGEAIGLFAATRFGLDVVFDRIGAPPPIKLARKRETIVAARPMPGGTPAADDADAFMSRHERDAILGFVDPCAFWGSFLLSGLQANGTTVSGPDIYPQLLTGPNTAAPKFWNRHKAYIDIRNDHGHSLNYYRETADELLAQQGSGTALAPVSNYLPHGWPSLTVPTGWVSSVTGGPVSAPFTFALPGAIGAAPLTYVSVGYTTKGSKLALRSGGRRFVPGAVLGTGYCRSMTVAIPLVQGGSTPQIHASYHKLHQFRRGGIGLSGSGSNGIAPFFQTETDHLFAMPSKADLPRGNAVSAIRIYGDLFFLPQGKGGCVARPGIAYDAANFYLFLFPVAVRKGQRRDLLSPAQPAWEETNKARFRPDEMLESGARLISREIHAASSTISLLQEQAPPATNASLSDNFWMIAMSGAELDAAIQSQAAAVSGTATLSLGAAIVGTDASEELAVTISCLAPPSGGGTNVARLNGIPFQQVYRDAAA